jgi:ATP-binding cassette, subfamily B, bacterial
VHLCLEQASLRRFWEEHPDDIALQLGPNWPGGTDLSAGQWQATAAARCFYVEDADLVVLDEPTAALDPEAQEAITLRYAAVARHVAARGGVAVLVTHRMSMPRLADRIVVLHDGRLRETGTHDELIASNGMYARAFRAQASGFLEMMNEVTDTSS